MKITYKQALTSVPAFKELQELKLPPTYSLQVYKLGKELDKELEAYRELSKSIYRNHKVPETAEGFNLKALDEQQFEKLSKDLEELLEQEMELKEYHIPFETFERFSLPISANLLIALDWLIRSDEQKPKEEELSARPVAAA